MLASSPSVDRVLHMPRGQVQVRFPAPGILHTWVSGHMDVPGAVFIRTAGNDVIARSGRLTAFHEWDQAESYDSEARKVLTDWGVEVRANVEAVHILFKSRLVAMGVSVAGVVLGRMIIPYQDRRRFLTALEQAVHSASGTHRSGAPG